MSYPVNYMLASSAGYKINIANEGKNPYDESTYNNKSQFKDITLTRPGLHTDLYDIHRKALITVNGYIHPTSFLDERLYVKQAVPTLLKTGINHVGIVSFFNVPGELEKIHITPEMISADGDYTYHEKVIITLPKSVDGIVFVFAGYMIFENERYLKRISDRSFVFYPSRINLIDKIYELHRYRNIFDELGVEVSNYNDSVVAYNELTSNDTIIKMLTLFNTFFVNVKGHSISYTAEPLEHTSVPNNYRTEHLPKKLLIGGHGKAIDYKYMLYNKFKYTVLTTDAYYNNLMTSYTPTYALDLINNGRKVGDTHRLSPVFFLNLECNKL